MPSFRESVRRNAVALISLALAMTSLGYTAWRNETNEIQRNHREAAFRILIEVGEMREVVLTRRYFLTPADRPSERMIPMPDSWVAGWSRATMVRDISAILPEPIPAQGQQLFDRWSERAGDLHADRPETRDQASQTLLEDLDAIRESTVALVRELR